MALEATVRLDGSWGASSGRLAVRFSHLGGRELGTEITIQTEALHAAFRGQVLGTDVARFVEEVLAMLERHAGDAHLLTFDELISIRMRYQSVSRGLISIDIVLSAIGTTENTRYASDARVSVLGIVTDHTYVRLAAAELSRLLATGAVDVSSVWDD